MYNNDSHGCLFVVCLFVCCLLFVVVMFFVILWLVCVCVCVRMRNSWCVHGTWKLFDLLLLYDVKTWYVPT